MSYLHSLSSIGTTLALESAHYPGITYLHRPSRILRSFWHPFISKTPTDVHSTGHSYGNNPASDLDISAYVRGVSITPSAVLRALQYNEEKALISAAITVMIERLRALKAQITPLAFVSLASDQLLVEMATQISWRTEGKVALYICPSDLSETSSIRTAGSGLAWAASQSHIGTNRLYISIPATWNGIQAARLLQGEGIDCNLYGVVTPTQAMACAQAGIKRISVPISAIKRWHIENDSDNPFIDLEALEQHPGIIFVKRMVDIFRFRNYQCTEVVPEDFSTVEEVMALAGIKHAIVSSELLEELCRKDGAAVNTLDRVRGIDYGRDRNSLPSNGAIAEVNYDLGTFNQAAGQIYADIMEQVLRKMQTEADEVRRIVRNVAKKHPQASSWV